VRINERKEEERFTALFGPPKLIKPQVSTLSKLEGYQIATNFHLYQVFSDYVQPNSHFNTLAILDGCLWVNLIQCELSSEGAL
jgi:hypothetical protein